MSLCSIRAADELLPMPFSEGILATPSDVDGGATALEIELAITVGAVNGGGFVSVMSASSNGD